MVGRTGFGPLGQLHKFASENIIETQLSGNLLGNIQMMSPPGIDVHFLKNTNVRIRIAQKIHDRPKLQAPVDVPIHNSNGTARPGEPLSRCEILGDDFTRRHVQTTDVASCGNTLCRANVRSTGSSISAQGNPSVPVWPTGTPSFASSCTATLKNSFTRPAVITSSILWKNLSC